MRKALGASMPGVITVLSLDFVKLVLLAFLIATPLAWYGIQEWLEADAYRINMDWWVFGIAGVFALLIAICTTTSRQFETALMNPVKRLRRE